MCTVLRVSSSGFYAWRSRGRSDRAIENERLTERIRFFHKRSGGTYGAPRITEDLRNEGSNVSVNRVTRLMRIAGMQGVSRRRTLYRAVILDVFSRRIVGWAMRTTMPTERVTDTLAMAINQRQPESVIHPSDQGQSVHLDSVWDALHQRPDSALDGIGGRLL